jgi:hypothetical protein
MKVTRSADDAAQMEDQCQFNCNPYLRHGEKAGSASPIN